MHQRTRLTGEGGERRAPQRTREIRLERMEASCPFCEIISGERHQEIVYSDETVVAFLCEPPAVWGHLLIVPRRHVSDIWGIESAELSAISATAKHLAD